MNFKSVVYLILMLLFMNNRATACSCTRGAKLVAYEVKRSTLVLHGKVIAVEKIAFEREDSSSILKQGRSVYFQKITLKVIRLFKGKKKEGKVVVYTGLGKGDCGFGFVVGQRYILYGNKSASPFWREREAPPKNLEQVYWTDICTRTQGFNSKEMTALRQVCRTKVFKK
jgi:hypothetical protein